MLIAPLVHRALGGEYGGEGAHRSQAGPFVGQPRGSRTLAQTGIERDAQLPLDQSTSGRFRSR